MPREVPQPGPRSGTGRRSRPGKFLGGPRDRQSMLVARTGRGTLGQLFCSLGFRPGPCCAPIRQRPHLPRHRACVYRPCNVCAVLCPALWLCARLGPSYRTFRNPHPAAHALSAFGGQALIAFGASQSRTQLRRYMTARPQSHCAFGNTSPSAHLAHLAQALRYLDFNQQCAQCTRITSRA